MFIIKQQLSDRVKHTAMRSTELFMQLQHKQQTNTSMKHFWTAHHNSRPHHLQQPKFETSIIQKHGMGMFSQQTDNSM